MVVPSLIQGPVMDRVPFFLFFRAYTVPSSYSYSFPFLCIFRYFIYPKTEQIKLYNLNTISLETS